MLRARTYLHPSAPKPDQALAQLFQIPNPQFSHPSVRLLIVQASLMISAIEPVTPSYGSQTFLLSEPSLLIRSNIQNPDKWGMNLYRSRNLPENLIYISNVTVHGKAHAWGLKEFHDIRRITFRMPPSTEICQTATQDHRLHLETRLEYFFRILTHASILSITIAAPRRPLWYLRKAIQTSYPDCLPISLPPLDKHSMLKAAALFAEHTHYKIAQNLLTHIMTLTGQHTIVHKTAQNFHE